MKPGIYWLAAALIFVMHGAPATAGDVTPSFQARCQQEMAPQFTVDAQLAGYRIDNTIGTRVLNGISKHASLGDSMLGLTALTSQVRVRIDGSPLLDDASGAECVAPQIDVELRFLPMRVYIGREFGPASCAYREILSHEMRHVQLYEATLPRLEALIRSELDKRFAGGPVYAAPGRAIPALQHDVDRWLRPMIRAELDKLEKLQGALDTREESHRLSAACLGAVAADLALSY